MGRVIVIVEEIVAVVVAKKIAFHKVQELKSATVKRSFAVPVVPVVFNHPV